MSMMLAAIAANRFGYGARPNELRAIAGDPRGWVKAQMRPEAAPPASFAGLPTAEDDLLNIGRFYISLRLNGPNAEAARRRLVQREGVSPEMLDNTVDGSYRAYMVERYTRGVAAHMSALVSAPRPAFERLVRFWANHFTVSAAKPQVMSLPQSFEREAIRPLACGSFANLLLASTKHPGMGVYLDNVISIGPTSGWARSPRQVPRIGFGGQRPNGLNENLGREILELHTLGVGGGYTQADVTALAKIITGWMYERPPMTAYFTDAKGQRTGAQLFKFEAGAHEPGAKTLLGQSYPEGLAGGESALRALTRHASTARHIATKLVRHYVSDAPPAACVDRVARAFQASEGDIPTVMAALIDSPEAWAEAPAKFKRPDEFLVSALRAFNLTQIPPNAFVAGLETMGQRAYFAPGPDGWADSAEAWLSADLVWKRLEWAQQLAERVARADAAPLAIAESALGPTFTEASRTAIQRAESPAQALVLFLMSPEFQRR
jgi:uncharacterized protein (DUF1800 family)